jgi:hypothetical protein
MSENAARVLRMTKERWRNIDLVRNNVKHKCPLYCRLHEIHIYPERDRAFRVCIFLRTDRDIEAGNKNGCVQRIKELVITELEHAGRGTTEVVLEIDSDENVMRKYGSYFARLH